VSAGSGPLVSIGVPVYNGERFLEQCLQSILGQTYRNIEVIVCDNASTDDTPRIVRGFRDDRIRYERSSANIGLFPNWNRCLELASGEFVAIYHADDVYEPEIVDEEVRFLVEHPEAGAVFSRGWRIDEEGRVLDEFVLPEPFRGGKTISFETLLRGMIVHANFLICPTFMGRGSVLDSCEGFRPDRFGSAADAGMWFAIAEHASIGVVDRPLIRYRIHGQQGTVLAYRLRTRPSDQISVLDHYLDSPRGRGVVTPELRRRHETSRLVDETRCLRNMIALGELREARDLSRRIYHPGAARSYLGSGRGLRYLGKRFLYSLLLESGLGWIAWKILSPKGIDHA
jgi:glycosyltransferase involved in cell wall biosynthesis